MSFESFPSATERNLSPKVSTRLKEIKEQVPENNRKQVAEELNEFKCIRILSDYKDPKDPSGLPDEVKKMMNKRGLSYHDYLVDARIEWMEQFEPWFDMLDTYQDWTTEELEQLIEGLT